MKDEYQLSFNEINPNPESKLKALREKPNPVVLLLDGIDDPRNLGSMFRLADAAGIDTIYGFRMSDVNTNKLEKVSRQTNTHISFVNVDTLNDIIQLSKKFVPIALEYTNKSIPYTAYKERDSCMLVIGNERRGVSKELLSICKLSLHIPMLGKNSSMNVSVATGIVVYHMLENMGEI